VGGVQIPDAVDIVVCAPDDGWWYYPKHVEQFPDKINCVTLHLVGYIRTFYAIKGKGKVQPRTGHGGPEGEQMHSSTFSSTSVHFMRLFI
jgi:hypothetical protein